MSTRPPPSGSSPRGRPVEALDEVGLARDGACHAVTGFLLLVLGVKVVVIRWWRSAGRFLPALGLTVFVLLAATCEHGGSVPGMKWQIIGSLLVAIAIVAITIIAVTARSGRPAPPSRSLRRTPGGSSSSRRSARGSGRLMAVVREIEPWDPLLAAGREDGRLVEQSSLHRARRGSRRSRPTSIPSWRWRSEARGRPPVVAPGRGLHAAGAGPVIVTTGTASGKSLAFNLPALDTLCRDKHARALYLYPSKALAQDQARALGALSFARAAPGDLRRGHAARAAGGDPAQRQRRLHEPGHAPRRDPAPPSVVGAFLANLAAVVVDEAHVYRGVFGSHVANVLRRLRRTRRPTGPRRGS